ncbi:glucose repression mediator protein [Xylographa pallens]|nr:glucose repression mediator protein [Xylographa pallens]
MASQLRQPSPPGALHPHHGPPGAHPQMNGHMPQQQKPTITPQHMSQLNEVVWLQIGNLTELMGDLDGAIVAYEQALRHNQFSIPAMNAISCILRTKENFPKAVEYLQAIVKLDANNGEVWGSLGHCYLMMEDLQQAYSAYQQALYYLRDPKEPKLWYGIGILYDRYGSLEHAEEAFSQVMRMQPDFEKANEIYFRLGIIYKQQQKFGQSLECFTYIVHDPPRPLTEEDIWFQIGHVHEQQKDYDSAQAAYRRVLERDPNHAKVLQQLGWLHHQQSNSFHSQEQAIEYLEKSVSSDNNDAQSWYLLGRCYMSQQKYSKAYEAYQQAVYRDGRNPTFWCSIGVLYYQINQYRDALDAYSRAIRLNPYISEVWYDLGTLYESCSNQTNDALDAYQRAADLDPTNIHIKARLQLLRNGQSSGMPNHSAPVPQDIHPQHYQAASVAGPPGVQWGVPAPVSGPLGQVPVPPGPAGDWDRRLAAIDNPQQPPSNLYGQRDAIRPPPQPRQPSPRLEQIRYQEQHRHTPVRRPSPPPQNMNHMGPTSYSSQQGLPQPQPLQAQQAPPTRITNPNYGAASAAIPPPPPPPQNGNLGGPGPMPPIGRGNSPPPEIRPITEDRLTSPGGGYSHQPYQHHSNTSQPAGIAAGAPPPTAALAAAEAAAARERDDRPMGGFKRVIDTEEDYKMPNKKPANGDIRGRIEDHHYHRGSPTERPSSPRERLRRSSSELRRDDQHRANENYHPSDAAHHPQILPALHTQPEQHLPPMAEPPRDERREAFEPAARKMDMDEDYNDEPEDEKRAGGSGGRNSPQRGLMNGPTKVEPVS